MLYRGTIDEITLSSTTVALASGGTVTARIKQEPRRLEAILVMQTVTNGAAVAANCDGGAGLLKKARLKITDRIGTRDMVNCPGPALLSWTREHFGTVDRFSWQSFAAGAAGTLPASVAMDTCYLIPIRHPIVAEPFGNALSLPLSTRDLKDDPILELEFYPAATVFSAGAPAGNITVAVFGMYRDVPESYPYVPSELLTHSFVPAAASKKDFEIANGGFLTGILVQGYSTPTYANNVTRVATVSATGRLSIEYGREIVRKAAEKAFIAINDLTQAQVHLEGDAAAYASGNQLQRRTPPDVMFDFLSDYPGLDAFSSQSAPNLDPMARGGDKIKVVFDTFANAAYEARITVHKFLPTSAADMKALAVAI